MTAPAPLFDLVEMEKRLSALDAERVYLVGLINAARAYETTVGHGVLTGINGSIASRSKPAGSSRPAPVMQATEEMAAELMETSGRPVSTSTIVAAMEDRGLPVPIQNPLNVISARMSNSTKFEGRRGLGWWFKDRPWPDLPNIFDTPSASESPPRHSGQTNTATDQ